MDAGAIKEVKVVVGADELKALTGEKKSRRPRTRKQRGGADPTAAAPTPESGGVKDGGGSLSPLAASLAEGPAARIEKLGGGGEPVGVSETVSGEGRGAPLIGGGTASSAPLIGGGTASSTPTVPVAVSAEATSAAPVVIGGKRGSSIVNTVPVAKFLPKRRLSTAPAAATMKKPKFKIGGGTDPEKQHVPESLPGPPGGSSVSGVTGGARGAVKQTRRFKERKIKLTVKSSRVAKAIRHKVKAKVRAMPIAEVRKMLLAKGIIKVAAAEKLPEEMLRNMLRDYMLLHNAE